MKLTDPFHISSRLMAAITITKEAELSIEYGEINSEGRQKYTVWLDIGKKEYELKGFKSGCNGGTIHEGFLTVLSFMNAAAEACRYSMGGRKSENLDIFVPEVTEWCYQNDTEIQCAHEQVEQSADALVE